MFPLQSARRHARWSLIATLALAGLIGAKPALDHLHRAQSRAALLKRIIDDPIVPPPPFLGMGGMLPAPGQAVAQAALISVLRDVSAREGLLVERLEAIRDRRPPVVSARLVVSGDARHVLRFAEAVESRTPIIRFSRWHLAETGAGGSALRLEAEADAPWEKTP